MGCMVVDSSVAKTTKTKYAKLCFRICETGQKYANFFLQQKTPGKLAIKLFNIFTKFTAQSTIHVNTLQGCLLKIILSQQRIRH